MQLNIHQAPQKAIQLKLRPCEAAELYLQKQPSRHAGNLESPQHIRSDSHSLMSDATSNKIHLKQSFSTAVKLGGTNKLQNTEMIICLDCVNFDRSAAQVQVG